MCTLEDILRTTCTCSRRTYTSAYKKAHSLYLLRNNNFSSEFFMHDLMQSKQQVRETSAAQITNHYQSAHKATRNTQQTGLENPKCNKINYSPCYQSPGNMRLHWKSERQQSNMHDKMQSTRRQKNTIRD
eukprot:scpid104462/ scgid11856/ 